MKSKNLMIIAVLLFLSGNIFAQGPEGFNHEEFQKKDIMNIPDLTEAQKTKLQDMRTANMKEMLPIRNELKEKEARLHTLSTGEKVNMDEVYKLIDEIGALKTSMAKNRAKHHQEIRMILTEDQRVFFDMHAGQRNGRPNKGPRKQ